MLKLLPTIKVTGSLHHGLASLMKRDCASLYFFFRNTRIHFSLLVCLKSVGDSAKNAFHSNPENTVFDAKRLIGRKFDDNEVQRDRKHWPFEIVSKAGKPTIQVKHRGDIREFVSVSVKCLLHRLTRIADP